MSRTSYQHARVFAALGDETRLTLVGRLKDGEAKSIAQLTDGINLTRQAVTKHLRVLEGAGIVHCTKTGRETLFELDAKPFRSLQEYLEFVSQQWDQALGRLKTLVDL